MTAELEARAAELRRVGDADGALALLDGTPGNGETVDTTLLRAHLFGDLGRFDEAVDAYQGVLARQPDLIDAHETLARLLPQLGRADNALDSYRVALEVAPDAAMLWLSALNAAKDLRDGPQLLAWIDAVERNYGREPFTVNLRAQALSWAGEDRAALDLVVGALETATDAQPLHMTVAHLALKLGDPALARDAAMNAAQLAPDAQTPWALLSTALRLLDDEREYWLADYQKLVFEQMLDIDVVAVAAAVSRLHLTQEHPGDQSLRHGTQTRGNLFDRQDPDIAAFRQAIETAVSGTVVALPTDEKHPFLRRRTGAVQFAGSWSVRLRASGFHIAHIHANGWLSSACYLSLPPEVDGTSDDGALTFGVPDEQLKLDLPPRRIIRPKPGQLVLFPSYMWHGTMPFHSTAPRLTAAFDVVPQ